MILKPLTVLLSGDHVLLRGFLRAWLSRFSRMQVVAEALGVKQTLEMVSRHHPTLVLMDFESHQLESLELLKKLRLNFSKVKVIVYFATPNEEYAIKLIRAGASGFVVKNADTEAMETAIKTVLGGGVYLSVDFLKSIATATAKGVPDCQGRMLNARQVALLKYIGCGLETKGMAMGLNRPMAKVRSEVRLLMKRIGVTSHGAMAKYAVTVGLCPA